MRTSRTGSLWPRRAGRPRPVVWGWVCVSVLGALFGGPQFGGPQSASAQMADPSFYVGLGAGGHLVLDTWNLAPERGQFAGASSGAAISLRLGGVILPAASLELESTLVTIASDADASNLVMHVAGQVLVHPFRWTWTPHVSAGLGAYTHVDGDLGPDTDIAFHVGVGVRGMLTHWLAFRGDARFVFSGGAGEDVAQNLLLTVGVDFVLAGAEEPEAQIEPAEPAAGPTADSRGESTVEPAAEPAAKPTPPPVRNPRLVRDARPASRAPRAEVVQQAQPAPRASLPNRAPSPERRAAVPGGREVVPGKWSPEPVREPPPERVRAPAGAAARTERGAVAPTPIAPARLEPTRVAPTRVEPTAVAPTRVEPTAVAPTRVEPTAAAPTRVIAPVRRGWVFGERRRLRRNPHWRVRREATVPAELQAAMGPLDVEFGRRNRLTDRAKRHLRRIANVLYEAEPSPVELVVSAPGRATAEARARIIRDWLVDTGVHARQLRLRVRVGPEGVSLALPDSP